MQIQPILGYFWAILGLYQPNFGSPPPLFFYISWIRPCMCVSFYYFPDSKKKLSQLPNLELDCPDFTVRYGHDGLIKSMNGVYGVYKTNIDCTFIRGMVENYCTLGKVQPLPIIHLGPAGLGVAKVEFHLGGNNFPPFPS